MSFANYEHNSKNTSVKPDFVLCEFTVIHCY